MAAAKNDHGKPPMGLLPHRPLADIARVLAYGATKYALHNWRAGLPWLRLISAAERHIGAWTDGETHDPESGINHLAHAACSLLFLLEYARTHPEMDDRYWPESRQEAR